MKRALVVVFAGLVVLTGATSGMTVVSPPAPPAPVAADAPSPAADASKVRPSVATQPNATNVFQIPADELEATRIATVHLSVGEAAAMDSTGLRGDFAIRRFDERVETADSAAGRRAVVRQASASIETRVAQLREEARAARQSFNDGGSASVYLRTVGQLHAEANALERYAAHVSERAGDVRSADVDTSLSRARIELQRFQGPVRASVAAIARGEANASDVYVATSAESVVLATVVDGEYRREAYHEAARQRAGDRTVNITTASDQIQSTYPWVWANQRALTASSTAGAAVFSFRLTTQQSDLSAYVDARTGEVYQEAHRQPLDTGYLAGETTERDGLRLSVNRSYAGGPMRVRLTASTTGEPVDGVVRLGGRVAGTTGADGTLWTVAPRRIGDVTAATIRGGENETVTLADGQ